MKNSVTLSVEHKEFSSTTSKGQPTVSQDINVLALVKGEERYVFLYNEKHQGETLRTLGRFASNPELSFTWYDAAVLSQKIRQESRQRERENQKKAFSSSRYNNLPMSAEND